SAEFRAHDGARRTRLQTSRDFAVFADVGRKYPGSLIARVAADPGGGRFFRKFHMAPGGRSYRSGVVVGISARLERVFSDLIPFVAGNVTGFAANAQGWVGKKRSGRHARRSSTRELSTAFLPRGRRPALILHTSALVSMMRTFGSSLMTRRSFTTSPV